MKVEKYEAPAPLIPDTKTTALQKIRHGLQKILGNSKSPEEIYTFLSKIQNVARNEFLTNQEIYKQQEDSKLFVENIQKLIMNNIKDDKYFSFLYAQDESHNFLEANMVHCISSNDIQRINANLMHPIDVNKHYSVNGISYILHLAKDDIPRLIKAATPVNTNLLDNWMTYREDQYRYLQLGDIMIKYLPHDNEFHIDFITLIKESVECNNDLHNWENYKKLVWIANPFPEINMNTLPR